MVSQLRTLFASTRPIESLQDLGPGRLLAESVPLAAVVALWAGLGAVAGSGVSGTAVRLAGVVMAGAYALLCGWQVATDDGAASLPRTGRALVGASVAPAIVCVGWVAAGVVLEQVLFLLWIGIEPVLSLERFRGLASGLGELAEFVGSATGFLAVVLYAAAFVRTHTTAGDDATRPTSPNVGEN